MSFDAKCPEDKIEVAPRRGRIPGERLVEERGLRLLVAGGWDADLYPARRASSAQPARDRLVNAEIQPLLEAGVRDGVFPAAQASVFLEGKEVGRAAVGAGQDTAFDLASLTKILCTAAAFVALWAEGRARPRRCRGGSTGARSRRTGRRWAISGAPLGASGRGAVLRGGAFNQARAPGVPTVPAPSG
jgi:hypothetical protein